jgi:methyl-accepting chemotaxis protein
MDETEPTAERRVVTPTARGTERVWAALGALSMRCKPVVPGPLSRTLNRQLWLYTCIAVGVPAVVVLLTRDPLWTLLALCGATVGVGGMIYGEMYRIIRQLEGAIDAIDREEYDVVVRERRPDEIDAVFRGVEGVAADLDRRITDATEARDRAERERARAQALVADVETTATQYSRTLSAAAAGDLTRRVEPESDLDAMVELGEACNATLAEFESTLSSIAEFAGEVAAASREAQESTDEIRRASEQVTGSIQEISAGVDDQTDQLDEVAEEMHQLSGTIEEIASTARQVPRPQTRRRRSAPEPGRSRRR